MPFDLAPQSDAEFLAWMALRATEAVEMLALYIDAGCTPREAAALLEREAS